jgi:hypothetical protein
MSNEKAFQEFSEESFRAGWESALKLDSVAPGQHRCDCFACRSKEKALYQGALEKRKRKIEAESTRNKIRAEIYSQSDYWKTRLEALLQVYPQVSDVHEKSARWAGYRRSPRPHSSAHIRSRGKCPQCIGNTRARCNRVGAKR